MKKVLKPLTLVVLVVVTSCTQISTTLASDASTKSTKLPEVFSKKSSNNLPLKPSSEVTQAAKKLTKKDKHGYKSYPESIRRRLVRTTSYSDKENEKGAYKNKNCIGGTLKYGSVRSAAADWSVYPVGTKFRVSGLSAIFVIDDYGSALVGTNTIDIYHPTLAKMRAWNTKPAEIIIIEMGDYDRSYKLLKSRKGYSHCGKMYSNLKKRIANGEVVLGSSQSRSTAAN